ncbi:MAG: cell division regulator GpsB [Bacilli bacterium]|nr:cell division regulator GpsB [Bacilli bacterium]
MIEERIKLTRNDILEKQFKIDARGYRPQEVDKFLDVIINDYAEFDNLLGQYENEMRKILQENNRLKEEIRKLKSTLSVAETNKGVTNVDILRRLGELEKIVYGEEN